MSWHHSNDSIELMPRQPSSLRFVLTQFRKTIYSANRKRTFKFGCDDVPIVQRHASASTSGKSQAAATTIIYIDECNVALQIINALGRWSFSKIVIAHYPWHLLSHNRERPGWPLCKSWIVLSPLCQSWIVFSLVWTQGDESLYCLVSSFQKIAPKSVIK